MIDQAKLELSKLGYFAIPAYIVFPSFDFDALGSECDQLAERFDDGLEPGVLRVEPLAKSTSVRTLTASERCLALLDELLPNGKRLHTVIFSDPLIGYGHEMLKRVLPYPSATLLLNLRSISRNNGAIRLIPSSHSAGISLDKYQLANSTVVWLEADKPTLFGIDNRLFHGSSKNYSGDRRSLLSWVYCDAKIPCYGEPIKNNL